MWGPGWTALPRAERPAAFDAATRDGGWTYDGHLRRDRPDEQVVLSRCDTIVWLDLPRRVVAWTGLRRSLSRIVTRERLWNGNVETWRMLLSREFSVAWAWRSHARLQRDYAALFSAGDPAGRALVRLRSRDEADRWLANVCGRTRAEPGASAQDSVRRNG